MWIEETFFPAPAQVPVFAPRLDIFCAQLYHRRVGKTYLFECPLCQYRVRVAGGADAGLNCEVQTVTCRECRELFDVFTRLRRRTQATAKFKALRPEVPAVLLRDFSLPPPEWKSAELVCPASAQHHVEAWNNPGRCPRCGCWLQRSGLPWRIWE